jgi:DNA-binding transcriptional ArsR family regulator
MVKNGFKSVFAYLGLLWIPLMSVSLKVLSDGRKRSFSELSSVVDFSHNTLGLHLESLLDMGLVL